MMSMLLGTLLVLGQVDAMKEKHLIENISIGLGLGWDEIRSDCINCTMESRHWLCAQCLYLLPVSASYHLEAPVLCEKC